MQMRRKSKMPSVRTKRKKLVLLEERSKRGPRRRLTNDSMSTPKRKRHNFLAAITMCRELEWSITERTLYSHQVMRYS